MAGNSNSFKMSRRPGAMPKHQRVRFTRWAPQIFLKLAVGLGFVTFALAEGENSTQIQGGCDKYSLAGNSNHAAPRRRVGESSASLCCLLQGGIADRICYD